MMLQRFPPERPYREPVFNIPGVIVVCIAGLVGIHALRSVLADAADLKLLLDGAFIPAQWTVAWNPSRLPEILQEVSAGRSEPGGAARLALARYVLTQATPHVWSFATYALLHGSWTHVVMNVLWLAAFGAPVARRCGWLRFLALALAATLGGSVAFYLANPASVVPMIGASAAVSGMMAAAVRFMFGQDRSRPSLWPGYVHRQPRLGLLELMRDRRAALFVGLWFATNLLFGVAAEPLGIVDASVAWEAHIGGFLVGLLAFPLVDPVEPLWSRAT